MLQIFEDHVANIMHVRGLSRSEAERFAFEAILIDHLNATHSSSTDPIIVLIAAAPKRLTESCR